MHLPDHESSALDKSIPGKPVYAAYENAPDQWASVVNKCFSFIRMNVVDMNSPDSRGNDIVINRSLMATAIPSLRVDGRPHQGHPLR